MRNMKRAAILLLAVLLAVPGYAVEADPQLVPKESCEHVWTPMKTTVSNPSGEEIPVTPGTRELNVNLGDFHAVFYYTMWECTLCGIQQEIPSQVDQPHHYQVTEWQQDADVVHVTYRCNVCEHIRKESLSLAVIQGKEDAPAAVNCMQGAACPEATLLDAAENWYFILPDGGCYNMVRLLMEEDGQQVTWLAARQHCKFCGRPRLYRIETEVSPEVYNSLPEFSYDQFMTYDADQQAPYQLIDMLRTLAPAA